MDGVPPMLAAVYRPSGALLFEAAIFQGLAKISHEATNSQGGTPVCHQLQLVVGEPWERVAAGFSRAFKLFEKPG